MAVKLRLMRVGKKKQPSYRVVAADSRAPRNGKFIEIVGFYQPRQEPSVVDINNIRALHWLQHGAQPTERVKKLLQISGAWKDFRSPTASATTTTPTDAANVAVPTDTTIGTTTTNEELANTAATGPIQTETAEPGTNTETKPDTNTETTNTTTEPETTTNADTETTNTTTEPETTTEETVSNDDTGSEL